MVCVYVLRLREGKRFVGRSRDEPYPGKVKNEWVEKYGPCQDVETLLENSDAFDEEGMTLRLMAKYGIDNVRGGSYSTLDLSNMERSLLQKKLAFLKGEDVDTEYIELVKLPEGGCMDIVKKFIFGETSAEEEEEITLL